MLCDLSFSTKNFPDSERYNRVVAKLPQDILKDVLDVVRTHTAQQQPDWTANYAALKDALVSRNSESDRTALQKLLAKEQRGERKPSQFLRALRQLTAGRTFNVDVLVKEQFLANLPVTIRTVLGSDSTSTLDELAVKADGMIEMMNLSNNSFLNAVVAEKPAASAASAQAVPEVANLVALISNLTTRLEAIETRGRDRERKREVSPDDRNRRAQSRGRSQSRFQQAKDGHCWYHTNFGGKAKKCIEPCIWIRTNSSGQSTAVVQPPAADVASIVAATLQQLGLAVPANASGNVN